MLQNWRKEAIYRKMRHYSRENERYHAQIAELEKRRTTCEAGLAAISACWTQILETIRLLTRPEDLPDTTDDIFNLAPYLKELPDGELKEALERSSRATQSLVSKFAQLGGDAYVKFLSNDAYRMGQTARSECSALKSQIHILRDKLRDAEEHKEKLHEQLVAAEIRCDRLQFTVSKTQLPKDSPEAEPKPTEEIKEVKKEELPSPVVSSPFAWDTNGTSQESKFEKILQYRNEQIERLQSDLSKQRLETDHIRVDNRNLPVDLLYNNVHYKVLVNALSKAQFSLNEYMEKCASLTRELDEQIAENSQDNSAPYQQEIHDLKAIIAKRDADLSRLRDLRDQQLAELNERKQKDIAKMASVQEFRTLTNSQSERISVLESQLRRCKLQLAAQAGDTDLFEFLLGGEVEISYVTKLKDSLRAAEARVDVLEKSLSKLESHNPDLGLHARTEAELHERLATLTDELQRYQRLCGDASSDLMTKLEEKDTELQKLRMLDKQREQAEASLYSEIDKISAAWEVLEKQVKNKIFDLANLEDRLSKSGLDKAKSENKFYTCMREKEAIEAERKTLSRNVEKQAKAIEKLLETEKSLTVQTTDLTKELSLSQRRYEQQVEATHASATSAEEWRLKADAERTRAAEALKVRSERERELDGVRTTLRQKEEELIEIKDKYEKELALANNTKPQIGTTEAASSKLQEDHDRLLLLITCGTCKKGFREVAITKCMHTFCKKCVDDRISNRQRKCPYCNLAFAQSDVQQLYFQ